MSDDLIMIKKWQWVLGIVTCGLLMTSYLNELYSEDLWCRWLVSEGGFWETAQAVSLLAASAILLRSVVRWRHDLPSAKSIMIPLMLAVVLLFVAGEELNWGQHWMKFQTPRIFMKFNADNECNLHDMSCLRRGGVMWTRLILQILAALFLIIFPLVARAFPSCRRTLDAIALPLPPMGFVPFAVLGLLVGQVSFLTLWSVSEIQETLVYFVILGTIAVRSRQWKASPQEEGFLK